MALEEEFEIDIPDEAAEKITTVGSAVDFIVESKAWVIWLNISEDDLSTVTE